MKYTIFYFSIVCLCISNACTRQPAVVNETNRIHEEFEYPFIQTKGKTFADFIPALWSVADTIYADLNGDNKRDALLLLTYNDTVDVFGYPDSVMYYHLFEQRVLLILYKSKPGYVLNTYCYKLLNFQSGMGRGGLSIEKETGMLMLSFEITGNGMYYLHYTFEQEAKTGRWILTSAKENGGNAEYYMNASYNFKNDSLSFHSLYWNNDENDTTWTERHSDLETIKNIDSHFYLDSMEYWDAPPTNFLPDDFSN